MSLSNAVVKKTSVATGLGVNNRKWTRTVAHDKTTCKPNHSTSLPFSTNSEYWTRKAEFTMAPDRPDMTFGT
ncbi:hypothetical protein MCOR03_001154 [Pyricularia oryzae]|nr:hypothetical protein MCOR03_001154 [Pyricularia oryzae]